MLRYFFVFLTIIEIIISALFIGKFGFGVFILEVILTAIIGLYILFNYGFSSFFSRITTIFFSGAANLLITLAGFFLLIPGILTDLIGISLLAYIFISKVEIGKKDKFKYGQHHTANSNTKFYNQNAKFYGYNKATNYELFFEVSEDDIIDIKPKDIK